MKAIFAGKRYDTTTADLVAVWSFSYRSDFHYCSEDLYRTKSGAWFINGEGGALSKYAVRCGQNETGGGGRITPLTPDEARAWLEEHGETAAIEEHFADEVQDA